MRLPTNNSNSDKALSILSWGSALTILLLFFVIVGNITWQGIDQLTWRFIVDNPEDAGRQGGIAPMLVSTLLLLFFALVIALPIGLLTAVYLAEYSNSQQRISQWIKLTLNTLAAVPSIVMGMFGFAFFVVVLKLGFSILAGSLTLAIMILPLLIRNIEDSIRSIPTSYRLNALSLGLSKRKTILHVLIPLAKQGIVIATILSVGRAMAETAALLFTSGYVMRMPESLMDSGRSLSVHIFDLSMNVPGGEAPAYGSATVLLILLLTINIITTQIGKGLIRKGIT